MSPPDPLADSEAVIVSLKECAYVRMAHMQRLMNAVTLAAEQIQDKRLELIETNEPDISFATAVFDVLFSLLLDSTYAGVLAAKIAQKLLAPLILWTQVFSFTVRLRPGMSSLRDFVGFLSEATKHATEFTRSFPTQSIKTAYEFLTKNSRLGAALICLGSEKDMEKNWTAILKAANRVRSLPWSSAPPLPNADSPGVSLLAAYQECALQQNHMVSVTLAIFEGIVRTYPETIPSVKQLISWEELALKEFDAIAMRSRLLFEAAIWAGVYGVDSEEGLKRLIGGGVIPKRLYEYWGRRFGDLIDDWPTAKGILTGRAFATAPLGTRQFLLIGYLAAIGRQMQTLPPEPVIIPEADLRIFRAKVRSQ